MAACGNLEVDPVCGKYKSYVEERDLDGPPQLSVGKATRGGGGENGIFLDSR